MMAERDKLSTALQGAAKESRGQGGRPAEGNRTPARRADAARRLARRRQQREGQAVRRPHRGGEARPPSRRPPWCASPPSWPALKDELGRLNAALDAADAKAKDQQAQIVDLGQKLNRALASKVEELARYRSEFFGKLREALAGQRDVQIVGDRFVFQSEVLFPSGSAAAAAGRREAARQRRPAADRDRLADPQGHQLGAAGRRPHRRQADQQRDLPVELGAVRRARHRRGEIPAQRRAFPTIAWSPPATASTSRCRPSTPPATGASSSSSPADRAARRQQRLQSPSRFSSAAISAGMSAVSPFDRSGGARRARSSASPGRRLQARGAVGDEGALDLDSAVFRALLLVEILLEADQLLAAADDAAHHPVERAALPAAPRRVAACCGYRPSAASAGPAGAACAGPPGPSSCGRGRRRRPRA